MERSCDGCGRSYEPRSPRSTVCSETCRKRRQRGARAACATTAATSVKAPADGRGDLEAAVLAELVEVERTTTSLGRASLTLARRIDGGQDTGAGLASLMREFRATLEAACANAQRKVSELDELQARRRAQRGA